MTTKVTQIFGGRVIVIFVAFFWFSLKIFPLEMSQAFETTYKRYFRWHEIDRRKTLKPSDRFADTLPAGGDWLIIKTLEEQKESGRKLSEAEDVVKNMYRNRLWSTYQLHYCKDMIPKERFEKDVADNELLKSCQLLYTHKKFKVLPPRPSARRVFGYLRPTYTYTPLTMYQLVHGKMGYDRMKKEYGFVEEEKKHEVNAKADEITQNGDKEKLASALSVGYPLERKPPFKTLKYQSKGNKICVCLPANKD